jgi:hypothetical protein
MDTRISRDSSNCKNATTAGKPVRAGPPATACSKGIAETPTTSLVTPGTSVIAERVTGNHQELEGLQQQPVTAQDPQQQHVRKEQQKRQQHHWLDQECQQ